MSAVAIRDVRKRFGTVEVLHGVSLEIGNGELVVLVGPSGCGKSTLLRMIAGLEAIDDGMVSIGDRVVNAMPPKERDIAMVFQNYALYPHMTIRDNMAFSLKLKGASREERDRKVSKAASILGLSELLDRYPRQLSGGQRQRVAMGRAIVRDPKVFLFDEPLSNLDAKLRVAMRTEIKSLHQRLKVTTIYVTHDQIEAMTLADRIVVMQGGVIEQTGAPLELYDRPANLFVASFIGSPAMNLIPATLKTGTRASIETAGGLRMAVGAVADDAPEDVVLGFRPEHISIVGSGTEAEVLVIEPTGSETQVTLRLHETEIVALVRERIDIRPGDKVGIAVEPERVHLFDAGTGRRI